MKSGTRLRRAAAGKGRGAPGRRARAPLISDLTAERLSVYLRCLDDLEKAGVRTVSSQGLADRYHLNSAQIRKDLACFGEFGVRGLGYFVNELRQNVIRILGLTKTRNVVILGAGNLGMALADYGGFNREGFAIVALFDNDPRKVGQKSRGGVPVLGLDRLDDVVRKERVSIAVLAIPAAAAEQVLDRVTRAGIKAVLNFAPVRLRVPRGTTLKAVDLKIQLENLVFHLTRGGGA